MKARFKEFAAVAALAGVAAVGIASDAAAGTTGGIYNMDAMLHERHPFLTPYRPAPAARPASAPAPVATPTPVRVAEPRPAATPAKTAAPAAAPARVSDGASSAQSMRDAGDEGWYGLSEIRVGALYADFGPFSHQKESGVNANLELLFVSPDFLKAIWSPRPHIGTTINTSGNTSTPFYAGLSWEWDFLDDFMWGFSLGGGYHNGYTDKGTAPADRKELGCPVLFRESLKLGYHFDKHHSLMAHLDHISNAKLCDTNEGLESLGIQYGYRF